MSYALRRIRSDSATQAALAKAEIGSSGSASVPRFFIPSNTITANTIASRHHYHSIIHSEGFYSIIVHQTSWCPRIVAMAVGKAIADEIFIVDGWQSSVGAVERWRVL